MSTAFTFLNNKARDPVLFGFADSLDAAVDAALVAGAVLPGFGLPVVPPVPPTIFTGIKT